MSRATAAVLLAALALLAGCGEDPEQENPAPEPTLTDTARLACLQSGRAPVAPTSFETGPSDLVHLTYDSTVNRFPCSILLLREGGGYELILNQSVPDDTNKEPYTWCAEARLPPEIDPGSIELADDSRLGPPPKRTRECARVPLRAVDLD